MVVSFVGSAMKTKKAMKKSGGAMKAMQAKTMKKKAMKAMSGKPRTDRESPLQRYLRLELDEMDLGTGCKIQKVKDDDDYGQIDGLNFVWPRKVHASRNLTHPCWRIGGSWTGRKPESEKKAMGAMSKSGGAMKAMQAKTMKDKAMKAMKS